MLSFRLFLCFDGDDLTGKGCHLVDTLRDTIDDQEAIHFKVVVIVDIYFESLSRLQQINRLVSFLLSLASNDGYAIKHSEERRRKGKREGGGKVAGGRTESMG